MLTRQQIKAHYRTPGIRDTIMRVSTDGESYRAGNWDFKNWYKYPNGKKIKLCLANRIDYTNMIMKCRTLYWTLNYFDPGIFKVDYTDIRSDESPVISRLHTVGYTFGIDIDREHGKDIHDPDVKKAVEDIAQYFSDRLRSISPILFTACTQGVVFTSWSTTKHFLNTMKGFYQTRPEIIMG